MRYLKLLSFTILVPGSVVGLGPYLILSGETGSLTIDKVRYLGWLFVSVGATFYAWSALAFLLKGGGTPAIWFTRPLRFLLGEEPARMVSSGLYRITRNPMYFGVLSLLLGQALLFRSPSLLLYFLACCLIFHFVVIFVEEPHLRRKFGSEYEDYLQHTPRWFGFTKTNK